MIYDCFPFYDELMLLEIRLNELYSSIDKFVLVEATHTHSGKPKRLYYNEVKDNKTFAPFKDKIIHIIYEMEPKPNRWDNENAQRNAIISGLSDAEPDDIIIVSDDIDEIIDHRAIPLMQRISTPSRLIMKLFYYYFNCRADKDWFYSACCRFKDYQSAHFLRNSNCDYHKNIITDAGWHFAYLLSPDKIINKLEAFAHAEFDTDYYKNTDRIQRCMDGSLDLFGRPNMNFSIEPLDAPRCVMENINKYRNFIK